MAWFRLLSLAPLATALLSGCYLAHERSHGAFGDDAGVIPDDACPSAAVAATPFTTQLGPFERVPLYSDDHFGDAIAWSRDGTRLAVAADQDFVDASGSRAEPFARDAQLAGSVTVYDATHACMPAVAYLVPDRPFDDHLGVSLALSADGHTLVAGAFHATITGATTDSTGIVYVFRESGGTWTHTQVLSRGDDPESRFGGAVALADGVLFVGDPTADTVTAFLDDGSDFVEAQTISGTGRHGTSVAATPDGSTVVVGAPSGDDGAFVLYAWSPGAGFTLLDTIRAADAGSRVGLGLCVSISDDGTVVAASSESRAHPGPTGPLVTVLLRGAGGRTLLTAGDGDPPLTYGDQGLRLAPDGHRIAWVSQPVEDASTGTVTIASVGASTLAILSTFSAQPGGIASTCLEPSGAESVAFSGDGRLAVGAAAFCGTDPTRDRSLAYRFFVYR